MAVVSPFPSARLMLFSSSPSFSPLSLYIAETPGSISFDGTIPAWPGPAPSSLLASNTSSFAAPPKTS